MADVKQNIWTVPFIPKKGTEIRPRTLTQYLRENYEVRMMSGLSFFGSLAIFNKIKPAACLSKGLVAYLIGRNIFSYGRSNSKTYKIDNQEYTSGNLATLIGNNVKASGQGIILSSLVNIKPAGILFNNTLMFASIFGGFTAGAQYFRQKYEIDHNGSFELTLSKSVGIGALVTSSMIYGTNLISRLIKPGNAHIKCWHGSGTSFIFSLFTGYAILNTIFSISEYNDNKLDVY